MAEESSKNHRDFFSMIFVLHPDLKYHSKDGVEGLRKAPRPKFMPFFLISSSVCSPAWKLAPRSFCSPTLYGQLLSSVLFSYVIPHGMKVVFVFPLPLTLRSGLKPRVVSVLLSSCVLVCSSVLGFLHPCAQGWTVCFFLFPRAEPSKSSVPVCLSLPPSLPWEPGKGWCHTVCWNQQWFLSCWLGS